jgi:segregation and condensation protein B
VPTTGGCEPRDDRIARLEAVFFLSQHPQSSRRLAQLTGLADGTKARTLVRTLNRRYDSEGSAFRIEEVAGGFQLMTRSKFAPWLRRLHSAPIEVRLSAPAMETLAVVAYRQPVLRVEIEAIRGVQSGEVLRQLIERDMVRIVGRSNELGRPFLYGTTKQFLQVFGLRHLEELPRADVLRNNQALVQGQHDLPNDDTVQSSNQSPEVEEETNVKTLIRTKPRQNTLAEEICHTAIRPCHDDRPGSQGVFGMFDEDEDEEEDEDDDFDDDEDIDDEDDDFDDEPWEEVDDDDEEEDDDDDDWDEDDDWDDDDDDWDDDEEEEDEAWGDDEDEEDEEKGKKGK